MPARFSDRAAVQSLAEFLGDNWLVRLNNPQREKPRERYRNGSLKIARGRDEKIGAGVTSLAHARRSFHRDDSLRSRRTSFSRSARGRADRTPITLLFHASSELRIHNAITSQLVKSSIDAMYFIICMCVHGIYPIIRYSHEEVTRETTRRL